MNLTVTDVAKTLRVHDRTVRNFIARGDLPAIRVGRRLLIAPQDLEVFCCLRSVSPNGNARKYTSISDVSPSDP
jgi:excisionase family DNA binding protein